VIITLIPHNKPSSDLGEVVVLEHDGGVGVVLSLVVRLALAPVGRGQAPASDVEARLRGQVVVDAAAGARRTLG
jgi:hypothetical protein